MAGRTLILGAASLVGRYLLPRLIVGGQSPLALSRRPPADAGGVSWIEGDLSDPAMAGQWPPISTVYSLSPIWLLPEALPGLIDAGAERVIAFSSTSRFTKINSPVEAERAVATKLKAGEEKTIALCQEAGVPWTILRPTLIYAEGLDGNVSRLARLISRFGFLPLAGRGEGLRQPVHAEDLALAALAVNAAHQARDRAYDLPGGETLTYRAMAERLFAGLGREPRILRTPAPLWSLAFSLAKPFLPGATAAMGARMSEDLTFDPEPARRDFGWSPRAFNPDFKTAHAS